LAAARAQVELGGDLLAFVAVQVLQVGLGQLARAAFVDHLVDHATGFSARIVRPG
jgi:hypothetical protein